MTTITDEEAMALLAWDIKEATGLAQALVGTDQWNTFNEVRQRVLINMCFNLGSRIWLFKKFISLLSINAFEDAAREMMDSTWAKQVGVRATRLRDMMATGKEPQ